VVVYLFLQVVKFQYRYFHHHDFHLVHRQKYLHFHLQIGHLDAYHQLVAHPVLYLLDPLRMTVLSVIY
jgi:hypothetical protein